MKMYLRQTLTVGSEIKNMHKENILKNCDSNIQWEYVYLKSFNTIFSNIHRISGLLIKLHLYKFQTQTYEPLYEYY